MSLPVLDRESYQYMSSEWVTYAGQLLQAAGYLISDPTGNYDDEFATAVQACQQQYGIYTEQDTIGPETWAVLGASDPEEADYSAYQEEDHSQYDYAAEYATTADTCGCTVDQQLLAQGDGEPGELSGVYEEEDDLELGDEYEYADNQFLAAKKGKGKGKGKGSAPVPAECRKTAKACFSISQKKAWLLKGDRQVVLAVPALGGRPGHETPTGQFEVQFKDADHVSSIYKNAKMPNYVNFTSAVGFHAGSLSVTSHGCVHLSSDSAKRFFDYLKVGDQVDVVK